MKKHNIPVIRGDDVKLRLIVKDDITKELVDLSQHTASLTVRDSKDKVLYQQKSSDLSTISTSANGEIDILFDHDFTATLVKDQYYSYDVQLIDANGLITTVCKGQLTVEIDVTR